MKIYVGNLSFHTTQETLRGVFADHGEVTDVALVTDQETGRSRGVAFVEMVDHAARQAIEALHGTELDGRTITVNQAKPRTHRSGPRGGGYGGSGGGRW